MTRVLVVDDQALVRAGFEALIESADDLEVVGTAANGREAVELTRREAPDVVLMDIRMPVMDGLEATTALLSDPETASTRILVLTTFDLDEYVYAALRAGASGFLLKDTPPHDLLAGIRVVAAGESLLSPRITRSLIESFVRRTPERSLDGSLDALTERETEVLGLVGSGMSNTEIGERLYVSPATVKTHIGRLLMKLDARDRAQLVIRAYESGLVTVGAERRSTPPAPLYPTPIRPRRRG
jgi:DNA-binding NarL/FixJ family response regulator